MAETKTKKITPKVINEEVKENASFFLFFERYSVKTGINDADKAPAITIWKRKSGILNAAKKTPRLLDAPKRETKIRYFKIPKI